MDITNMPMRPVDAIFPERRAALSKDRCVFDPRHEAIAFRDDLSRKDYTITGMCQDCQDDFYGGDEQ